MYKKGEPLPSRLSCWFAKQLAGFRSLIRLRRCWPQRSEARAQLLGKQLRLFPRGKVPAFSRLVVVDEFEICPLRPTPRSLVHLLRENANGSRNGDLQVVEKPVLEFRIEPSRR